MWCESQEQTGYGGYGVSCEMVNMGSWSGGISATTLI